MKGAGHHKRLGVKAPLPLWTRPPQRPSAGHGGAPLTVLHVGPIPKRSSPKENEGQLPGGAPAAGLWAAAAREIPDFPQHRQVSAGAHGQTSYSVLHSLQRLLFFFRFGRILEDLDSLAGYHSRYLLEPNRKCPTWTHIFPLRPQFSSLTLTPLTRSWRGLPSPSSPRWSTKSVTTAGFTRFCPTKEAVNKCALLFSSDMRHHVIYPDCDVKFTGHVTWVGKTSIEAKMHMSQVHARVQMWEGLLGVRLDQINPVITTAQTVLK